MSNVQQRLMPDSGLQVMRDRFQAWLRTLCVAVRLGGGRRGNSTGKIESSTVLLKRQVQVFNTVRVPVSSTELREVGGQWAGVGGQR